MKKIFSISLIILTVATLLQLSVSTHWCCGRIAATKVSLTGKTTDCGMESKNYPLSSESTFTSHCCKNVVVTYGITCNYFPSFHFVPDTYQQVLQHFSIPERIADSYSSSLKVYSDKSPPHHFLYQCVDLSEICILRI